MTVSDRLHARVQAYVAATCASGEEPEPFDLLACDLARFQASCGNGLERLLAARRLAPEDLLAAADIPAIPTDAFKLRRIACHEPAADTAVFRTSGTTVGARGTHAMRSTATYEAAARAWARVMLFPDQTPMHVLLLAPPPHQALDSSLGFMLALFGRTFGSDARWLIDGAALKLDDLREAVANAAQVGGPVFLAGASFGFVHLLDSLHGDRLALPAGSRVMQTGGFKGKSREVESGELRREIASAFGLDDQAVLGEYGMTELSSQAYEGTLRAALGYGAPSGPAGVYHAPPWMRVVAVEPETLEPVEPGHVGIARVVDLANVDSAVVVQTADQIRTRAGGFELLGRAPSATPRGCSIGVDELLGRT
ncbi:MAG: acyl-protein synthetase [Deltaproteobacteria bacterium]|nr:acyl-protein synthetase [Deltaproteobacteria bacterium]